MTDSLGNYFYFIKVSSVSIHMTDDCYVQNRTGSIIRSLFSLSTDEKKEMASRKKRSHAEMEAAGGRDDDKNEDDDDEAGKQYIRDAIDEATRLFGLFRSVVEASRSDPSNPAPGSPYTDVALNDYMKTHHPAVLRTLETRTRTSITLTGPDRSRLLLLGTLSAKFRTLNTRSRFCVVPHCKDDTAASPNKWEAEIIWGEASISGLVAHHEAEHAPALSCWRTTTRDNNNGAATFESRVVLCTTHNDYFSYTTIQRSLEIIQSKSLHPAHSIARFLLQTTRTDIQKGLIAMYLREHALLPAVLIRLIQEYCCVDLFETL
jgi:hypothetical protein